MWDMVPVPEDVLNIPRVVQQKLEFDLSMLTTTERRSIQARKQLEQVCRYPVEELHQRALKAEPEIGALMVYLMKKHGVNGCCEQMEQRRSVRGQLNMLRQLVDCFVQKEGRKTDAEQADTVTSEGGSSVASGSSHPAVGRSRSGTLSNASFAKVKVGVNLREAKDAHQFASIDLTANAGQVLPSPAPRGSTPRRGSSEAQQQQSSQDSQNDGTYSEGQSWSHAAAESLPYQPKQEAAGVPGEEPAKPLPPVPDEATMRDKLRELEAEAPPLKYKIVVGATDSGVPGDFFYTQVVMGFLRDIANDADYDIYAVNNWCATHM